MRKTGVIFILLAKFVTSHYYQIEDIPIESYDQVARQDNDMDLELLPRKHRSFDDPGPKEYFFRSLRSIDDDEDDIRTFGTYSNIPRPITLTTIYTNIKAKGDKLERKKRAADEKYHPESSTEAGKQADDIVFSLGKPLEIANIETIVTTPVNQEAPAKREEENLLINDFIRFRRSTRENSKNNSASGSSYPEKINLDTSLDEINRETRGVTRDQWIKQPYPVRKTDEMAFMDNVPMSSENHRVPRVNFVEKTPEDSPLRAEFRPYGREARSFNDLPPRDQFIEPDYYRPRYARPYYGMERPGYPSRDDMYYRGDSMRDVYRPRYENYEAHRVYNMPSSVSRKSHKRIIYYATLPEVPRHSADLRDRHPYERYEDRYFQDPYRPRKGGYQQKSSRFEEGKTPFPVKVSTDVNVREVKKNPERRIYSEVDRNRYAYENTEG